MVAKKILPDISSENNLDKKYQNKSREELISDLHKLQQENNSLKALKEKEEAEFIIANKELVFQNEEKEKRASELLIANKELAYQNEEKEKTGSRINRY